ncbi:hypothetical protein V7056_09535 [Bacillus sp. JJ664]
MLLVGTCVIVGLIIVFMGFSITKDQISMTKVIESHINKVGDLEK